MRKIVRRRLGQAIVEFALAATLIFFLLAAAVDLGLIFFTVQGLHNAAQEGAAYGSRWLEMGTDANGRQIRVLNFDAIQERVRKESGSKGGIGFVNLLDLNNDGTPDVGPNNSAVVGANGTTYQKMPDGTRVIDNFIQIQLLYDVNADGDPMNDLTNGQPTPCTDTANQSPCFVRVTVSLNYKTIFPLTPGFARTTKLRSSYLMPLRDSFNQGGQTNATPIFATMTPPPPTPCPALFAPSLSGSGPDNNNNVTLSWGAVNGATQYQVYQAQGTGSFGLSNTVSAPSTSVSDKLGGSTGTTNKYYVVAVNGCGQKSVPSNQISFKAK